MNSSVCKCTSIYERVETILCHNENLFVLSDPSKYFYNLLSALMSPKKKKKRIHTCMLHIAIRTTRCHKIEVKICLGPGNDLKIFISPQETQQKKNKKKPE